MAPTLGPLCQIDVSRERSHTLHHPWLAQTVDYHSPISPALDVDLFIVVVTTAIAPWTFGW